MVEALEQAVAQLFRLPDADQEQIGRKLLSHVERLTALRHQIDKASIRWTRAEAATSTLTLSFAIRIHDMATDRHKFRL